MLIGLNGYKGCGKDTTADYLRLKYDFEKRSFAWGLKKSVAALFDISIGEIEILKNQPKDSICLITSSKTYEISFREFLQKYGTEAHRDIFGYDFWIDHLLPKPENLDRPNAYHLNKKIVITDARFDNELKRIKDLDGFNIRINRGTSTDEHVSEAVPSLELIDYHIDNNGSINDLHKAIDRLIIMEKL